MSASPAHSISATGQADDVFERLARCDRLLTAKELADILAISPKTLYNYVTLPVSWVLRPFMFTFIPPIGIGGAPPRPPPVVGGCWDPRPAASAAATMAGSISWSFGPLLATVSAYTGIVLVSLWSVSWNRSVNKARSMSMV